MWKRITVVSFLILLLGAMPALGASNVIIKGSTTVLPIAQAAAEAYMKRNPGVSISISGGGSGDGIKALIDKTTDIADSSRDLMPEEVSLAKARGVNPVGHKVAIDAIVPIVHPTNPVQNLTIEQLSLIYRGKIRNWKEVGGVDKKIVAISRDTSSGTYETWESQVLHGARVTPRAQLQVSSGIIVQAISGNKYAIGYIGIGYLNNSVKAVSVNGVAASVQAALSGKYPIARPLLMFTDGEPEGAAGAFIRFVLGPAGQAIVKQTGYVPIR